MTAVTADEMRAVDRVVTLALPKTGLATLPVPISLADISVPAGVYDRLDIPYEGPFADEYLLELTQRPRS